MKQKNTYPKKYEQPPWAGHFARCEREAKWSSYRVYGTTKKRMAGGTEGRDRRGGAAAIHKELKATPGWRRMKGGDNIP